tara:strand:+ start:336 stop:494 length:159 start_codon:yes stop_codon:yes gene_type:complete
VPPVCLSPAGEDAAATELATPLKEQQVVEPVAKLALVQNEEANHVVDIRIRP